MQHVDAAFAVRVSSSTALIVQVVQLDGNAHIAIETRVPVVYFSHRCTSLHPSSVDPYQLSAVRFPWSRNGDAKWRTRFKSALVPENMNHRLGPSRRSSTNVEPQRARTASGSLCSVVDESGVSARRSTVPGSDLIGGVTTRRLKAYVDAMVAATAPERALVIEAAIVARRGGFDGSWGSFSPLLYTDV
jgi:hypothetical protein